MSFEPFHISLKTCEILIRAFGKDINVYILNVFIYLFVC